MVHERRGIIRTFNQLSARPIVPFPAARQRLTAPYAHGVYVIRDATGQVLHVGRTTRRQNGLHGRLADHLAAKSSFVNRFFDGDGSRLRESCTFQYIEVPDARKRALVEAYASAWLCPRHLGLAEAAEVGQ